MTAGRFRKRPVEIDAYCFDQEPENARPDWFQNAVTKNRIITYRDHALIYTLEGIMRANLGDWIVRGVEGEFYPVKPGIFTVTYEEVK